MNDTFRQDHLGCYGNSWIHTPNLDRFAERAALFEQYYIASYPTAPHRWDLSTGCFGFPSRGWQPLDRDDVTLAQLLGRHGVHTQVIWDTPMLDLYDYNYTRGFKGVLFVHGQKGDPWITDPLTADSPLGSTSQDQERGEHGGVPAQPFRRNHERQYCCARTMSEAMGWLETNTGHESFFLYVDMWDPHEPFDCPPYDYERYADPDYDGDFMMYPEYGRPTYMSEAEIANARALYAGGVTLVDRWVGRFLDLAERLGLFDNTLIIWASDHGHLFGDHDLQGKPGAELGKLYEITTRIPLIVHHPEGLGAGERIRGIVQPPDMMPSVLEFMGVETPSSIHGKSFWPLVRGETERIRDFACSSRFPPTAGSVGYAPVEGATFDGWAGSDRTVEPSTITDDDWAYIAAPAGMPSELYDLRADPQQANNVIDEHPDVAERLRQIWLDFLTENDAADSRLQPFLDADVALNTPHSGELWAIRDDLGQWIAYASEAEAHRAAWRENAPGPQRQVECITFGQLLDDNPRNLVQLYSQFYWGEDLA